MDHNADHVPVDLTAEMKGIAQRLNVDRIDESDYFPQFFQIETIRHCNAHCPFCASDKWDMSKPLMDDWLYDKIVEELGDYRDWVRIVDIQRAGEPLLDKKLAKRVKQMKDVGMRFVNISTNASLLDETRARALLEAGIDEVLLSIDSIDKDSYEKLRVGLNYDVVVANIRGFFKLRDQINPKCVIRVRGVACFDTEDPRNHDEMARWEAFWKPLSAPHDRIYMKRLHTWGNTHVWDEHSKDYERDLFIRPCIIPWSTLHVTAMGIVPLCGQDMDAKMNLGDITKNSIAEVWRAEGFRKVREMHRSGQRNDISFCQGCRVFDPDFSIEKGIAQKGHFHVKPLRAAE